MLNLKPTIAQTQYGRLRRKTVRLRPFERKTTMQKFSSIKYFSFIFCIFLAFAELTSSVPFYSDYESNEMADSNKGKDYQIRNRSVDIRDLYELLLKKDALDDQLGQPHIISRKSNRSPSLRLRFGKKRDPYYANPPLNGHPVPMLEDVNN